MASASSEHVVRVRAELDNTVVVRQGDTLIIATSRHVDHATAHAMTEQITERLPGVEAVIIDGTAALAVYEPGEWEPTDDQIATWIRRNPEWFRTWAEKYNRIHGNPRILGD